jgi:hypothetical protein
MRLFAVGHQLAAQVGAVRQDGRAQAKDGRRASALAGSRRGLSLCAGLVAELAERGLKVDYRSIWGFVHAERLAT